MSSFKHGEDGASLSSREEPVFDLIQLKVPAWLVCSHGWSAASVLVRSSSHLYLHFQVQLHPRLCALVLLICPSGARCQWLRSSWGWFGGARSGAFLLSLLSGPVLSGLGLWNHRSWSDICNCSRMCELLHIYFVDLIHILCGVDADGSVFFFFFQLFSVIAAFSDILLGWCVCCRALQFSASQAFSQVGRYHSNIMLNKQEGSSERGFYFHECPIADFCLHKMVRVEELFFFFLLWIKVLSITPVSIQPSSEDMAPRQQQSDVALNHPRSTSFSWGIMGIMFGIICFPR